MSQAEIDERLDVLRRCIDRAQEYFYAIRDTHGVDHMEHMRNELQLLENLIGGKNENR